MLANTNLISCNFSCFLLKIHNPKIPSQHSVKLNDSIIPSLSFVPSIFQYNNNFNDFISETITMKKRNLQLQKFCFYSSLDTDRNPQEPAFENEDYVEEEVGGGGSGPGRDWTTSFLLFGLWAGLMYYVFFLAPNQTPVSYQLLRF